MSLSLILVNNNFNQRCLLLYFAGNIFTDSVIDYHLGFQHPNNTWAPAAIAIWNGGGLRASIEKGKRCHMPLLDDTICQMLLLDDICNRLLLDDTVCHMLLLRDTFCHMLL